MLNNPTSVNYNVNTTETKLNLWNSKRQPSHSNIDYLITCTFIFELCPLGFRNMLDVSDELEPSPLPTCESTEQRLLSALNDHIEAVGVSAAVSTLLENIDVKEEVSKAIFTASHKSLKSAIKSNKSKLTATKSDRNYLLTLTPKSLCEEFANNSKAAFDLVIQGLFGISSHKIIFESQYLLNCLTFIYSIVARVVNRNATGYALLLTTTARDGGLREDSLNLFSCMVHPRTSQKYDKETLSQGWDMKLQESLKIEEDHFAAQKEVEIKIERLYQQEATFEAIAAAKAELETLKDTTPPQLQGVWDNLNLRTKHRFERVGDSYADSNLDWMASLWVKDRISANHMEHRPGVPLKRHF